MHQDLQHEQIDRRDIFMPIVSTSCMDKGTGEYTKKETSYAIAQNKKIIPIKHPSAPDVKDWKDPYSKLSGLLYLEFNLQDDKDFIRTIIKLCKAANVPFKPLVDAHEKLPFWSDFRKEISEIPTSNYHYTLIMEYLWDFNKFYQVRDYEQAEAMISIFVNSCRQLIPDYKPHYPLVVWAVCLRHLGKQDQAEECYLQARDNFPERDKQNIFAGLGGLYLEREDYTKSYDYYKKSLEHSKREFNDDEKYNYVTASLNIDRDTDRELEDFVLGLKENNWGQRSVYLYQVKAMIYSKRDEYENALDVLDRGAESGHYNEKSAVLIAWNKWSLSLKEEAISFLEQSLSSEFPGSILLAREIMEYTKSLSDFLRAREYFEKFLLPGNSTRKDLVEYALLYYFTEDIEKSREIARSLIDRSKTEYPATNRDLYYDGFAHFLAEEYEMARMCYMKSNLNLDYYDELFKD